MENISKERVITVVEGEEYKLHISNDSNSISEDIFYDSYCQAFEEVEKIIDSNEKNSEATNALKKTNRVLETSNNIIVFCGERGQGKSSAMLSFSTMLKNNNVKDGTFKNKYEKVFDKKYHIVERIDPTELENQQSIVGVIISRIFFDFKNHIKNTGINDIPLKNDLLELFQKCYHNINLIKNGDKNKAYNDLYDDDLEMLSNIGDNTNIKNNLLDLITKFLKFVNEKDYLVIQIDDTDLNVENAYYISEDIRKFFMIPNVIVLMATKPEILTKAIEQEYIKNFSFLINENKESYHEYYKMASKYLQKLIPGTRRIMLPEISLKNGMEDYDYKLKYVRANDTEDYIINADLQDGILNFINQKTGLILLKPSAYKHNLIPTTARELVNMLSVINSMDDIKAVKSFSELTPDDIKLRLKNLQTFQNYIFDSWMEENLKIPFQRSIKEWYDSSWKIKNKLLGYYYNNNLTKVTTDFTESLATIEREKTRKQKRNTNYSYHESMRLLSTLDSIHPEQTTYKFTFVVRLLYSIAINKFILQRIINEKENPNDDSIKELSVFIGDVFGDSVNSILPKENGIYPTGRFSFGMTKREFLDFFGTQNLDEANALELFCTFEERDVNENVSGSMLCTFDVGRPLISIIENRVQIIDKNNDLKHDDLYDKIRYLCFQIISNSDVLHKIENDLMNTRLNQRYYGSIKSYTDYSIIFYEIIKNSLNKMLNLKLSIDFSVISKCIGNSKRTIDFLYNSRFSDEQTKYNRYVEKLKPYINTKNAELLDMRLNETGMLFNEIMELNIANIYKENYDLRKLMKSRLSSKRKNIKESTCKDYQAKINKLRKSVLKKILQSKD